MSSEGFALFSTVHGLLPRISEAEHIRQSIFYLLTVRKGERPYHPEYGNRIHDFIFLPNSPYLRKQIENHILEIVTKQEPRARDVEVSVQESPNMPTLLNIIVRFQAGSEAGKCELSMNLELQGGEVTRG